MLKIPFTATEFCPPAAQLVSYVWARFTANNPPFFQPRVVSAEIVLRLFSPSVTCPIVIVLMKDSKKIIEYIFEFIFR